MKKVLVFILAAFLFLPSCSFLAEKDVVLTTIDNVTPECIAEAEPVPMDQLPAELRVAFEGRQPVLVGRECVKDEKVDTIPISGEGWNSDTIWTVVSNGLKVGGQFFPFLAGLEGLLSIFFRRKRQHYAAALKAILPFDGKVDLMGGLKSIGRALGTGHSSSETAKTFETQMAALKT